MKTTIESLIRDYAASSQIEIELEKGQVLRFKGVSGVDGLTDLEKRSTRFVKVVTGDACYPDLKDVAPKREESARVAFYLADLSEDPKLSNRDACLLVRDAPGLASALFARLLEKLGMTAVKREEELQERLGESSDPAESSPSSG